MCVYHYNSASEKYEEVTDVFNFKLIQKMIHKEEEWSGYPYYFVVKLGKIDPKEEDKFYPLPLLYATKEEQEKSAAAIGKTVPDEALLKSARNRIAELICDGPLTAKKMDKWIIPSEYRELISGLVGNNFFYDEGDVYIEQIIRHRGEDVLLEIIEKAGYSISCGETEFAIWFTSKDLGEWNPHDKTSHEETCLKFAAYCCAMRANNDGLQSQLQTVDEFICRLRNWLEEINAE